MKDEFIKKINGKTATEWYISGLEEKDPKKQLGCYSKCLELNPKYVSAWEAKGIALHKLGRYDDEIKAYDKMIEIDPKYAYPWIIKGNALLKLKRYEDAIKAYDKAIEIDSEDANVWKNKRIALHELGRYEDEIKSCDKIIEIDSKYTYPWVIKGNTLLKLKRYEDAIKAYDKAIEIDSEDADAWNNKGEALHELERYEDAIKSYDKAIEIDSEDADAWNNKGEALHELERYEDAIKSYEKAIEIDPKYAYAWIDKGFTLRKLERYEDAIESFEKVIEIDPKNEIVKRILKLAKDILIAEKELKHVEEILIAEKELKHVEIAIERLIYVIPIPNIIKSSVRLCLVQLDFHITDKFPYQLKTKEDVKEKILKALEVATKEKVNIICFPELSFAEELIDEVKKYKDIIIIGGSYYHNNFNICPVIINGEVYPVYKIHPSLFEIEIASGEGMKSGNDIKIFESEDGRFRFGVLICIDYLKESDRLYRYHKGINFIFNPSFNPDIKRFQKRAELDCVDYSVTLIQTNVKEYGGTCIIGIEHNDIIERLISDGYRTDDKIRYKLCEAEGEMMIIVDFNLEEKRVPTLLGTSPRIKIIGRYKYKDKCWQEYKSGH